MFFKFNKINTHEEQVLFRKEYKSHSGKDIDLETLARSKAFVILGPKNTLVGTYAMAGQGGVKLHRMAPQLKKLNVINPRMVEVHSLWLRPGLSLRIWFILHMICQVLKAGSSHIVAYTTQTNLFHKLYEPFGGKTLYTRELEDNSELTVFSIKVSTMLRNTPLFVLNRAKVEFLKRFCWEKNRVKSLGGAYESI